MEEKKPYYKETIPSMHRRCKHWDYKGRGIYMLTLVVQARKPILCQVSADNKDVHVVPTELGQRVLADVECIPNYYPQIRILCKQIMPDHLHILLFVQQPLPVHLTTVVSGFKTGCTRHYRTLLAELASTEHTERNASTEHTEKEETLPTLWEAGYHDRILFHEGQLGTLIRYIQDNPRRLTLKRANPQLFRLHQRVQVAGIECTTLGNMFLLDYPIRAVVQCSRSLTQAEIDLRKEQFVTNAERGVVHISAAISEGEKQICRALREAGFPLIILLDKGFPPADSPYAHYYKPQGIYFEACAAGKLLLIEPAKEMFEQPDIVERVTAKAGNIPHECQRFRFLGLNFAAERIAGDTLTAP